MSGRYFSLYAARKFFPKKDGRPCSHPTVYRYSTAGSSGVILKTVKLGNQRYTTEEWIEDFYEALAAKTAVEA